MNKCPYIHSFAHFFGCLKSESPLFCISIPQKQGLRHYCIGNSHCIHAIKGCRFASNRSTKNSNKKNSKFYFKYEVIYFNCYLNTKYLKIF